MASGKCSRQDEVACTYAQRGYGHSLCLHELEKVVGVDAYAEEDGVDAAPRSRSDGERSIKHSKKSPGISLAESS